MILETALTLYLTISPPAALSRPAVIAKIRGTAVQQGVNPNLAQAVGEMESGKKLKCGDLTPRRPWNKKLFGPMGVRGAFLQTGKPEEVIWVGVKALRPRKGEKGLWGIMRRYNPGMTPDYRRDLLARLKELENDP